MNAFNPSARGLANLLEERTGQRLAASRSWRIDNMLASLYRDHNIGSIEELSALLRKWPDAVLSGQVVEALLNKETYFFRDRVMFDTLVQKVLPRVVQERAAQRKISIWSTGCSTGQEVYSLAMAIAEAPAQWDGWTFEILGTDISASAIEAANRGEYTGFQVQRGLGVMQMLNWFEEIAPDRWRIKGALRDNVRFKVHNVLDVPSVHRKFDIVLCRNVLLYFDAAKRQQIFDRIANTMSRDAWLMLGASESVVGQTNRFRSDDAISGFYRVA